MAEEYRIARSKYEAKLYRPALADLGTIQKSYPNSPEALAAYFLSAEIHEVTGNIEEAMATYVEIQGRYPNDARLAETTYRLGRLSLRTDAKDRSGRAVEIFDRVVSEYPTSSWAPKATRSTQNPIGIVRRIESALSVAAPPGLGGWLCVAGFLRFCPFESWHKELAIPVGTINIPRIHPDRISQINLKVFAHTFGF